MSENRTLINQNSSNMQIVLRQRYYARILRDYYYKIGSSFNYDYHLMDCFLITKFGDYDTDLENKLKESQGITAAYNIVAASLVDLEKENNGCLPALVQTVVNSIILETL